MASEDEVKKLRQVFNEITEVDIENLIRAEAWGSINFDPARADLTRLFSLCDHFKALPLEELPGTIAEKLAEKATPVSDDIKEINKFTIEQENPKRARDELLKKVTASVDAFYIDAHIYIPYLAYQNGDVQGNLEKIASYGKEAKDSLVKSEKYVKDKSEEIDKIIQAAKEASASVGVGHFTADFQTEAETMEGQAKIWLCATVFLGVVALLSAIYFLFATPDLTTVASAIQYVSSKILILVLLITATLWCGNLFKAAKHQAAANKFKGNSLKTFRAFVKATDDNGIRDAVLVETTRAIFSESATGYIKTDNSGAEKSTKIVEVVKNGAQTVSAAAKS